MYQGGCHCGTIRYQIKKLATTVMHCHCHTCRKTNAAPMVPTAGVTPADLTWLQGKDQLTEYRSSENKSRYFCRHCGCHIYALRDNAPYIVLRVATLDELPETRCINIWLNQRLEGLEYGDQLENYQEMP